jgi:hypothetical protein
LQGVESIDILHFHRVLRTHDIAWLDQLIANERAAHDTSSLTARPDTPVSPAQEDKPR